MAREALRRVLGDGTGHGGGAGRGGDAAALNAAEVLVRENRRNHYSRYAETHLTYAEVLIVWRGGVVLDARR